MRLTRLAVLTAALSAPFLTTLAFSAGTPEQQCQATKNKTAAKYAACRQGAEAKLATTGDATKYGDALTKCGAKLTSAWQKATDKAIAAGATCLDDPLTVGDFQTIIDAHTTNVAMALGGGGLTDCSADLATCAGDLSTCNGDLSSCTSDLSTCGGDLSNCDADLTQSHGDLATCNGSLSTCNGSLGSCTGSLSTCNGSLTTCTGSLSSCNTNLAIETAQLAACSATLSTVNAGTAGQGDVLAGQTFSSGAGTGITGTMPNNGAASIAPGVSAQSIAAGYHNGAGTVAGDADLVAGNIKTGVDVFGVTGTFSGSAGGLPKTGQTTSYGTGSDGNLQKGTARAYTDNGDGTITDGATGLMWEKKSNDGSIHDKDNTYTWGLPSSPYTMNGTMVTTFLAALNGGGGFAGQTDWRIPNIGELQSLTDYQTFVPPVSAAFNTVCGVGCTVTTCSCTQANVNYWSSTTYQGIPGFAWWVSTNDGNANASTKSNSFYVRAVRGGS